jgi:molecular chaperone HtpG
MKDMSMMGGASYMSGLPDSLNLVVNGNHPLIAKLNEEKDETHKKDLAKQLVDLAKLSQNLLKGEELTGFIKRSINIIQ